jgi:hypothetical protein
VRNHPDKWHDLTAHEKTTASFIIKEYGHVFHTGRRLIVPLFLRIYLMFKDKLEDLKTKSLLCNTVFTRLSAATNRAPLLYNIRHTYL